MSDLKAPTMVKKEPIVEKPVIKEPVVEKPVIEKPVPAKKVVRGDFKSMRPCDMIIVEKGEGIEVTSSIGDYFCGSMEDFKKLLKG